MTAFTSMQPQTSSRVSQLAGSPLRQQHKACFSASRRSLAVRASGDGSRVDKFDKHSIIVSPSILSADFAKLGEQVLPPETAHTCVNWQHKFGLALALISSSQACDDVRGQRCLMTVLTRNEKKYLDSFRDFGMYFCCRSRLLRLLVLIGSMWMSWTADLCQTSPL